MELGHVRVTWSRTSDKQRNSIVSMHGWVRWMRGEGNEQRDALCKIHTFLLAAHIPQPRVSP